MVMDVASVPLYARIDYDMFVTNRVPNFKIISIDLAVSNNYTNKKQQNRAKNNKEFDSRLLIIKEKAKCYHHRVLD